MRKDKKTMVLGVSPDPGKRAHQVCKKLLEKGHTIIPLGIRPGKVSDISILTKKPQPEEVHTIVIYLRANRQKDWISFILASNPKRIIFNPGAENPDLEKIAKEKEIEVLNECTLLMLSSNRY